MADVRDATRAIAAAQGGLSWAGAQVLTVRGVNPTADALVTGLRDDISRMMGDLDTLRELVTERG